MLMNVKRLWWSWRWWQRLRWLPGALLVAMCGCAQAQGSGLPAVSAARVAAAGGLALGPFAAHLEDPGGRLTIDAIRAPARAAEFEALGEERRNFGYTKSAHWLRFTLEADAAAAGLLLEIALPSIDSVQLFMPAGGGFVMQSAGDLVPWDARGIKHRNPVLRLQAGPRDGAGVGAGTRTSAGAGMGRSNGPVAAAGNSAGTPVTYYLRLASENALSLPLTVWQPAAFAEHQRHSQLLYGAFYGLLAAMLLYNLALLLYLRDIVYLYYTAYVASFGMALFAFDGFAFEYLWPHSVWWANHSLPTAFGVALTAAILFLLEFLMIRAYAPRQLGAWRACAAMSAALALCGATGWLIGHGEVVRLLALLSTLTAAAALWTAARWVMDGYPPARLFLLAWSVLLVSIVLSGLRNFALVPANFLTVNGLHIGIACDVLLLSFALGSRINLLRRSKLEAEGALLASVRRHEQELSVRVAERTAQLEIANQRLQVEAREREALVHKLAEDETRMRHLAQHDALTGLPNRRSLQERFALAAEFAKRNDHKIAVLLLDLDRFKELNDSRGHAAGDEALIALAGRLRATVRGADTVARWGGDEFVILASDLDGRNAVQSVLEKLSDVISIPISAGGGAWTLSASIGVAFYPDDGSVLDDLLNLADSAMYSDKAGHKRRGIHQPVDQAAVQTAAPPAEPPPVS